MMDHLPENSAAQVNQSAGIPPASLGRMLREGRELLGLSVADVAAQTKFAIRQIEALEADDFKSLPETAFLRGFVRSYAKILDMDAEILLATLPQTKAPVAELIPASVDVPFPVDGSSQKNLHLLGAALLLGVVVAGFAVWHFSTPPKQAKVEKIETPVTLPAEKQAIPETPVEKHEMIEPSKSAEPKLRTPVTEQKPVVRATKSAAASAVPHTGASDSMSRVEPASAVPRTQASDSMNRVEAAVPSDTTAPVSKLRLVFDEESWTEIKDRDGNMVSSQINPSGSELNVKGLLPLSLVIGHAASVHLYQDGEPIDLTPFINSSSEVARITLE